MPLPTNKYFLYPFAVDGVTTPVGNATDPGGVVTYQQGFGDRYTRELGVDPAALPYPQPQHNSILLDVTLALQAIQQWGIPRFITPDDNAPGDPPVPTPFPYAIWAYALYDDGVNGPRIYQSLENTNIATPADFTKWGLRDNVAGKITLDNSVFQTGVVDGDIVYFNSSISKFDLAVANGTAAQQVIGVADVTNLRVCSFGSIALFTGLTPGATYYLSATIPGEITATLPTGFIMELGVALNLTTLFLKNTSEVASDIPTGSMLDYAGNIYNVPSGYLLATGGLISRTTYGALLGAITFSQSATLASSTTVTGLSDTSSMYIGMPLEGSGIPSSTTVASIVSGSSITISHAATTSGSSTLTFFPYGNGDGSTTFTLPDTRGRSSIGLGQGSGLSPRLPGEYGGEELHSLTSGENGPHGHDYTNVVYGGNQNGSGGGGTAWGPGDETILTGISGAGDGHNTMHPFYVCTKIIKT